MDEAHVRALFARAFRVLASLIVLAIVVLLATFVWPTRYRYDHMTVDGDLVPVRIDRLSGDADMLVPDDGWVPVESSDDSGGTNKAGMGS